MAGAACRIDDDALGEVLGARFGKAEVTQKAWDVLGERGRVGIAAAALAVELALGDLSSRDEAVVPKVLGLERLATLTIHHGRHTFLSHALAGGRTLAEVRDAAGHTNVSITSAYLHAVVDEEPVIGDLFKSPLR